MARTTTARHAGHRDDATMLVPLATGCLRVRAVLLSRMTWCRGDHRRGEASAQRHRPCGSMACAFSQKVTVSNYDLSDGFALASVFRFDLPGAQLANMNSDAAG